MSALLFGVSIGVSAGRGSAGEAWDLKQPAPTVALRPAKLEKQDGLDCARCHAAIVEEWAATAHAIAWVDEVYRDELADKRRPETCYGCHAPKPLLSAEPGAKPVVRDDARHLGISCLSCHLGPDGALHGPRGTATDAHPTKKSEAFSAPGSNVMCASCHRFNIGPVVGLAKDFEQSKQAARGRSCVACHTHEIDARFATGDGVPERKGRSHSIQTPRDPTFLARAFAPTLRVEAGRSVVTLANRAGHRVPGLIGRTIEFQADVLDAQGRTLGSGKLALDTGSYLPVDESLDLTVAAAGAKVHLVGRHQDPRAKESTVFLDLHLEPTSR